MRNNRADETDELEKPLRQKPEAASDRVFRAEPADSARLIRHNTRVNVVNGVAAAAAVNLVNPYFAKFAERLGATEMEIALLSSLPALISVFALIPGAIMIDVLGQKQRTTAFFMFLNRVFLLLIALIPFLPDAFSFRPMLFISMIALMNFPGSIYANGYNSSIADIFEPRERGRATALRNRFSDITRISVTLLSGLIMLLPQSNASVIRLYQIYFIVAFGFGLLEVSTYRSFIFPQAAAAEKSEGKIRRSLAALKESFRFTVKDKEYRAFLICSMLFHFGWQMGWALFNVYQIKVLHATEIWFSAINIAAALASIFTATAWMRFADRHSHTLTIIFATFGMSVTPFLYVLSSSLYELVFYNVIIGFSITGTTLLLLNILLNRTPSSNRTTILSIYVTLTAISQSIVPILGVRIMQATSIQTALIVTGCFRLLGCLSFVILHIRTKKKPRRSKDAAVDIGNQ